MFALYIRGVLGTQNANSKQELVSTAKVMDTAPARWIESPDSLQTKERGRWKKHTHTQRQTDGSKETEDREHEKTHTQKGRQTEARKQKTESMKKTNKQTNENGASTAATTRQGTNNQPASNCPSSFCRLLLLLLLLLLLHPLFLFLLLLLLLLLPGCCYATGRKHAGTAQLLQSRDELERRVQRAERAAQGECAQRLQLSYKQNCTELTVNTTY
jgi:hypothetical protein